MTFTKFYDRLVVRNVNPDLLLCMKLVAFKSAKVQDMLGANDIIVRLKNLGYTVTTETICQSIIKYYGSLDVLSKEARLFIGLRRFYDFKKIMCFIQGV